MSDKVLVTVRKDDETAPVWQRILDRDSSYFQRFRDMMQVDLDRGYAITITPLSDLQALAIQAHDGISSVSWARWPG